jgi:large subunit ribosomal protein L10
MSGVNEAKKQAVQEVVALAKQYKIVGVVNMEGLPTATVQNMRAMLRSKGIDLRMAKKRLLKIAFDELSKDIKGFEQLSEHLKGMPAIICTNDNPFKLYKMLQANKSNAPAKGGQEAPGNIVVPAGPTSFAPGPIIGELGKFGIKAGIDGGKVAVKEDAIVAKEGDIISAELAGVLTRMGIEPMEIGLDLRGAFEEGFVFTKDTLAIDEDQYLADITNAHRWAFNLAVESSIFTSETTELLVGKAFNDSKALAIEQCILSKDVIDQIIAKAQNAANAVKTKTE